MRNIFIAFSLLAIPVNVASTSEAIPNLDSVLGLPRGLLHAIAMVESGGNPHAVHKNDGVGDSLGIAQIKLATARLMGFKGTKKQLMRPHVNLYYAGLYLKHQIKRYHGDFAKAVTAYNAGTSHHNGGSIYMTRVFNTWVASQ